MTKKFFLAFKCQLHERIFAFLWTTFATLGFLLTDYEEYQKLVDSSKSYKLLHFSADEISFNDWMTIKLPPKRI